MSPSERQQLTEHKRQRTTRQQDRGRRQEREAKAAIHCVEPYDEEGFPTEELTAAVSSWARFLEDWKQITIAAMSRGGAV